MAGPTNLHRTLPPAPVADVVLCEPLEHGIAGSAWSARQVSTGDHLVVKLFPNLGSAAERLADELPHLAALTHPALVPIRVKGLTAAGIPFLVLDHQPVATLAGRLVEGPIPAVAALGLVHDLAEGLAEALDAGFSHGAIVPEAVCLVTVPAGPAADPAQIAFPWRGRLADVGLLDLIGGPRPGLRPPEDLVPGPRPAGAGDVFALGVLLYRCCAGRPPVLGQAIRLGPGGGDLARLIEDCLARDPDQRPVLGELAARCAQIQRSLQAKDRPRSGRIAPLVAVVALAVAGVVVGLRLAATPSAEVPSEPLGPITRVEPWQQTPVVLPATDGQPASTPSLRKPAAAARSAKSPISSASTASASPNSDRLRDSRPRLSRDSGAAAPAALGHLVPIAGIWSSGSPVGAAQASQSLVGQGLAERTWIGDSTWTVVIDVAPHGGDSPERALRLRFSDGSGLGAEPLAGVVVSDLGPIQRVALVGYAEGHAAQVAGLTDLSGGRLALRLDRSDGFLQVQAGPSPTALASLGRIPLAADCTTVQLESAGRIAITTRGDR